MTDSLVSQVVSALRTVAGESQQTIGLHEPCFGPKEAEYVNDCITSGWVSTVGSYTTRLEQQLVDFTQAKHAIVTVNGTAALHVALLAAGVTAGTEVLMPTLTFVATANAVSYCGATPHFVDVCERTLGIDVTKLADYLASIIKRDGDSCYNRETGKRISAIVPMHTFGHPVAMDELIALAELYHLPIVEDAAESLGSFYRGRHTGTFGLCNAVSFNGNKIITTGGGGAVLTNDDALAQKIRHLTTTGKLPHQWEYFHDCVAYNYRMPNLNAALGCAQLEALDDVLNVKRRLAMQYRDIFSSLNDRVQFITEPADCRSNYWLNGIRLLQATKDERDLLLQATSECGLICRPVWQLLHTLPMYQGSPKMDTTIAERLVMEIINIPSGAAIGRQYV